MFCILGHGQATMLTHVLCTSILALSNSSPSFLQHLQIYLKVKHCHLPHLFHRRTCNIGCKGKDFLGSRSHSFRHTHPLFFLNLHCKYQPAYFRR
ncbi:hypothetical protein KP509_24G059600 [Ceratopteris richardii]|nr:hypothetical protein KP509_24G059600 [Ceratopteris richardii]